jgi:hypothetical protein
MTEISGTIYLYDKNEKLLVQQNYSNRRKRTQIIEQWEKDCDGTGWIQISPDIEEEFVRPPAVYDNRNFNE